MNAKVLLGYCESLMSRDVLATHGIEQEIALTFLDPPFNQGKDYAYYDDSAPEDVYWGWMRRICEQIHEITAPGGALYFMQREKNAERVLATLRETDWTLQNVIIWRKRTSAVPGRYRYGKQYQVIAFATKGKRPLVFNRLRIDAPLQPGHKHQRTDGVYVTDCWDDIRELTSGYFAGDEALRLPDGERLHKQQSPVSLLLRVILSSTMPGHVVLDPFVGTGTALVVAEQLGRQSVGMEIDPSHVKAIRWRIEARRKCDSILPLREYHRFTKELDAIWPLAEPPWDAPNSQLSIPDSEGADEETA